MEGMAQDESLQKALYQLSVYEAQAKELTRQAEMLQSGLADVMSAQSAIRALATTQGATIFPLGARIFILAKQQKPGTVMVDCGSGVMIEKTTDEAIKDLEESTKSIREGLERAQAQLSDISKRASQLQEMVEEMSHKP